MSGVVITITADTTDEARRQIDDWHAALNPNRERGAEHKALVAEIKHLQERHEQDAKEITRIQAGWSNTRKLCSDALASLDEVSQLVGFVPSPWVPLTVGVKRIIDERDQWKDRATKLETDFYAAARHVVGDNPNLPTAEQSIRQERTP